MWTLGQVNIIWKVEKKKKSFPFPSLEKLFHLTCTGFVLVYTFFRMIECVCTGRSMGEICGYTRIQNMPCYKLKRVGFAPIKYHLEPFLGLNNIVREGPPLHFQVRVGQEYKGRSSIVHLAKNMLIQT